MRRKLRSQGREHESDILSTGVLLRRKRVGFGGDVGNRRTDGAVVVHQLVAEAGNTSHRGIDVGSGGHIRRSRRVVNRRRVRVVSSIVLVVVAVVTVVARVAIAFTTLVPQRLDNTGRRIEREDLTLVLIVHGAVCTTFDSQRRGGRGLRIESRTERLHRC